MYEQIRDDWEPRKDTVKTRDQFAKMVSERHPRRFRCQSRTSSKGKMYTQVGGWKTGYTRGGNRQCAYFICSCNRCLLITYPVTDTSYLGFISSKHKSHPQGDDIWDTMCAEHSGPWGNLACASPWLHLPGNVFLIITLIAIIAEII